jgi:hypothetical protein
MRFLKKTAQSLSGLNLQQIPLMELLGEPSVPGHPARTVRVQFLERENAVQEALAIHAALTTGDLTRVSVDLRTDLLAMSAPKTLCTQPGVANTWLDSVQWIATKTSPYLAAEDLTPVWQAVRSSACFAEAKGNERTLLDYLESLARRDRQAIVAHGTALLDASDALTPGVRPDVVVAVAAALLGSADPKPGIELLKREIDLVNRQREVNLPLRLVEAIALERMSD